MSHAYYMSWRAPKRIQYTKLTQHQQRPTRWGLSSSTPTTETIAVDDAVTEMQPQPLHHSQPRIMPQPHHNSAKTTSSSTPTTEPIQPLHHSQPHVLPQLEQHQPMKKKSATRMKQPCTVPECNGALYVNLWNHIFQTHKAQGKYSSELLCIYM